MCTIAHMGTDSEIHFMSPHTLPMTETGVLLQISTSFQLLGIGEVGQEPVTMVLTVESWYVENHTLLMPEPAEKPPLHSNHDCFRVSSEGVLQKTSQVGGPVGDMLAAFHQGRDDIAEGHQGQVYIRSLFQSHTLGSCLGLALGALNRKKEPEMYIRRTAYYVRVRS